MADTHFMQKKYSLDVMISQYCDEIKRLRAEIHSPSEESKLQTYYQAASTFKNVSIKEWIQFAMSYGRGGTPKSANIREAFSIVLGNRVQQVSPIDLHYAQLLLEYAKAFRIYTKNMSNWVLGFLLSSNYSPLSSYFKRELDQVIQNTENKVLRYQASLKN